MYEEKVILKNEQGLNAQMAARFVQIASKYRSKILLLYEDKEVNVKSIMSLLTMAIPPGDEIILRAKGEDEVEAVRDLLHFVSTGEGTAFDMSDRLGKTEQERV